MTDVERIVLVDLGKAGRWDATRLGTGLTISAPDADGAQTVSRAGAASITSAFTQETYAGSWVAIVQVTALSTGYVAVGVRSVARRKTLSAARLVNSTRDQDAPIGQKTNGYAVTSNGLRYTQGASVSTGLTYVVGDKIIIRYNAVTQVLSITKNDVTTLATWTGVAGPFEVVATPAGSGSALRLITDIDDVPWTEIYRPAGIWGRVSTGGWMTPHSDTQCRNTYYDGRIDPDSEPNYDLRAVFPLIDPSKTRAIGDFQVINTDRGVGIWLGWTTRDETVTVRTGNVGQTFSDFIVEATARIEELAPLPNDEDLIKITPRDEAVRLDVPWQAEQYPNTATVDAIRNTTKPTGIGSLRFVPLTMTDGPTLAYDLVDDAAYAVSAVYDKGVALSLGSGYSLTTDRKGVRRLTNPEGKQVADIVGQLVDSTVFMDAARGNYAGVTWTGSPAVPPGWDRGFTGGTSTVTSVASGARFLSNGAGGTFASLHTLAAVFPTVAMTVRIDIVCTARAAGTLNVRLTDYGASFIDVQIAAVGSYTFYVAKPAGVFALQLFTNFAEGGDLTIQSVRATRVEDGSALPQFMKHLVTERGPLPISQLDVAAVAAVHALRPWPLCLYTGQGDRSTVLSVLDRVVESIGAGWWVNSLGVLSLMTLDLSPGSVTVELTDDDLIGDLSCDPIQGRGLSDRVGCVPNWSVHTDGDIAGSLLATSAGRVLADQLKRPFLSTTTGANRLAPEYQHAVGADPQATLLATTAGGQGLANLKTDFYKQKRHLYGGSVYIREGVVIVPGTVIRLTSAQYDFDAGRVLQVVARKGVYSDSEAQLMMVG